MGKTADTETATYDVLSRLRHDGKRYGVGESVELTAKQHAQAFASGAVSEEPVDPSEADGDGDGGGDSGGTKETKPPAKKKAAPKKAVSKKAATKKAAAKKPLTKEEKAALEKKHREEKPNSPIPGEVPEGSGPPPKPER